MHVLRHAAAVVLRVLPVVAQAAVDAPPAAVVRVLDVAVVAPPDAVAQRDRDRAPRGTGTRPGTGRARRDPVVGAVGDDVAVALQVGARAAGVVREGRGRRAAIADAELQRVVAAELVRHEIRAVGLQLVRRPQALDRREQRAAAESGRPQRQLLLVPEAVGVARVVGRAARCRCSGSCRRCRSPGSRSSSRRRRRCRCVLNTSLSLAMKVCVSECVGCGKPCQ